MIIKFYLLTVTLLLAVSNLFSQCPDFNIPKQGKSIQSFVTGDWFLKDSVSGDFNQDGIQDYVIVLASKIEEDETNVENECNRPILILQGRAQGFLLSSYTRQGVLCKRCGGAFGDPYEQMSLKNNVLEIDHYAGSNWRWGIHTTFRFQKNQWQLIGYSYISYFSAGECEDAGAAAYNLYEANFSTGKAHIVNTKDDACKPYRDRWQTFTKKAPVLFSQYDVTKDYFPLKK
jgi:hypothetical protein